MLLEMAKEKKARYIVELDLILETFQFHILEKRLEIARTISNAFSTKNVRSSSTAETK